MKRNTTILKWSLSIGAIYFFAVAAVHLLGLKVPGLYVYFDVPSHAYQDRIISFLCFGWSVFLFAAFLNPIKNIDLMKAILIAGAGAVVGLGVINITADFRGLGQNINVSTYWVETFCLSLYLIWLIIFYFLSRNEIAKQRQR